MNGAILLAALTLGQFYSYDYCTPATYVAPAEEQVLQNTGPICSKFYISAVLNDGYKTQIPVINCKIPSIKQRTTTTGRVLYLDYARGITYNQKITSVKYTPRSQPAKQPTPAKRPAPAPILPPALPDLPPGVSRVPLGEPEKAPIDDDDYIYKQPSAPAPPSDDQIDKLLEMNREVLKRVDALEQRISAMEVVEGTTSPLPQPKVEIEKVKTESYELPSGPSYPKDATPKAADDISGPTYQ
jgi:hypothetical protein